jgi:predicted HTH domain antitoxin
MPAPNSTELVQREGRIALAVQALQKGHVSSLKAATRLYSVPRTTLRRRVHQRPARCDTRPTNCKLTATEELTLVN